MNIIFLDFDGVLNCETFYEKRGKITTLIHEDPSAEFCKDRVKLLNELCETVNAKVVISSTWRYSGLDYCKKLLKDIGATFDVIGMTPSLNDRIRGNEISVWLNENNFEVTDQYAIIDDDSDMLDSQLSNFFQTTCKDGLTKEICDKIKTHFNEL